MSAGEGRLHCQAQPLSSFRAWGDREGFEAVGLAEGKTEREEQCVYLTLLRLPVPHGPLLGPLAHRTCCGWGSPAVGSVWPLSPPLAAGAEARPLPPFALLVVGCLG